MAKEITLEELAGSANKKNLVERPNTANPKSVEAISISDLASAIEKNNPTQTNGTEDIVSSPIINNAYDSMFNTIGERLHTIDNGMQQIAKNLDEMEEAQEMGIDPTKVNLDEVDIFSSNNEVKYNPNNDTKSIDDFKIEDTDAPVEKESTPKKQSKKKSKKKDENDEFKDDLDALDDLMKDLNDENDDEDEEDEEDNDDFEEEEETSEELRARFKESLNTVKITKDPIDLSKFTIRKHAVSSSKILSTINEGTTQYKRFDWPLYYTGRCVTFEESRGQELDALRKTISRSNNLNNVKAVLEHIYKHIVDANKPSFEQWCKLIRTEDIESLYFGHYAACYADGNLVARTCSKADDGCGKTSLIDTNIRDMVKFDSDETKEKFYALLNKDTTTESDNYEAHLLQISDDFVISYCNPTIYSTFIQYSTLSDKITDKYSDILDTMAYIDSFYKINRETNELIQLAIPEYPNNFNRTVAAKLKVYSAILKTLTSDQYNVLTAKLSTIIENSKISYIYPETTCPECGTTIKEEPIESIVNLLFTRAQLAQVKSL